MPRACTSPRVTPRSTSRKSTFLCALGSRSGRISSRTAYDPIGVLARLRGLKSRRSRTVGASISGSVALLDAVARIEEGVVTAGSSSPAAPSSSHSGSRPSPSAAVRPSSLPFGDGRAAISPARAVGLVVRGEAAARAAAVPALADRRSRVRDLRQFGGQPARRHRVVLRALGVRRRRPGAPVLVDLYGQSSRIDDGAEPPRWRRSPSATGSRDGLSRGDRHYVVGTHGLQGLVRLLEARATGAPRRPFRLPPPQRAPCRPGRCRT